MEAKDVRRWNIIYPVYLSNKKTVAEGRRVSLQMAIENPTANEIQEVCKYLGLECVVEPDKAYSRDYMMRGRARILLKKEDGTPIKPEFKNKKLLYAKLCELIPRLQSRAAKAAATTAATNPKAGKKKGKK
eukprot:TRINITY_DN22283_c0_g1_i1.p1 TRINITY_DN22283_c0_g1~~TRINITY_DN22283_c0_g1_i1.p1  ORF type:complete len:150 (+),score=23.54 TRINITY_DN22283_c0_g1_i1:59-451(+)